MTLCSPAPLDRSRLLQMLRDYGRDEFWLRVNHVFHLACQSDQISFDVVDADGVVMRDRKLGHEHAYTWQSCSPWVSVVPGQLVHVVKDGNGVWVRILPLLADYDSSGFEDISADRLEA